ncbi:hypothetical protein D9V32_03880 [Mycetocola tolaasinivorans]|uniref:Glycosyltransferase RgtA/B/C/D-like domain-containing protein n=1 Tax=Mycetocola tolaasinivorans TaxID=76635 RepID=A0A3L7A8X5_9MICO|nr:hypothetical protein [Mycetocola tolaasinivorans]RLP76789.1 hypothetical protein D9V32_03880 [Mycetocola tolaasinivorans]
MAPTDPAAIPSVQRDSPPPAGRTARGRWVRTELIGVGTALLLTTLAVTHLLQTDRSWLLFGDGDSVFPQLVRASLLAGEPQHWALSSVLFIPELALYLILAAILPTAHAALVAYAACSMLLIYGALRLAAAAVSRGDKTPRSHPRAVGGALAGLALLTLLTLTESSITRSSFELTTLVMTPTYYGATTIALLLGAALCAWLLSTPRPAPRRVPVILAHIALAAIVGISTLSNPLIGGWLIAPACVALLFVWRMRRPRTGRAPLTLIAVLSGATVLGFLLRFTLGDLIAKEADTYVRPNALAASLDAYGAAFATYIRTPGGVAGTLLVLGALACCAQVVRRADRENRSAALFLGLVSVVAPIIVIGFGIALGTDAPRYLAPVFFAPLLGITALIADMRITPAPIDARIGTGRQLRLAAIALTAITALLVGLVAATPRRALTDTLDRDAACAANWLAAHDVVAIGSFWDARPVNAQLGIPGRLLQVDPVLNRYVWLDNRGTVTPSHASVLLRGPWSPLNASADSAGTGATETVSCGNFSLVVYPEAVLPIGPPHA